MALICDLRKLLETFIQKNKGPRIAKVILKTKTKTKKTQEFGLALPDIKFAGAIGYIQVQILKSKRANV